MKIKTNKLIYLIILLLSITLLTSCTKNSSISSIDENKLMVHFIDVGQGDSILIQIHGKNMLIDAGTTESRKALISYLNKQHIKKLDYVIETHPHEDHIGGMSKVIDTYTIDKFYAPKVTANTKTFENMINSLNKKSLKIQTAKSGLSIDLGAEITCKILAPNNSSYSDLNNYSTVVKITYGANSFLFEGDAQKLSEDEMIAKGFDLSCDVLKVGHHGSRTSTSEEFLKKTMPKIAIISCGLNNDYGHPHKPTLTKLQNIKAKIYRTDKDGTIVLTSDGRTIHKN